MIYNLIQSNESLKVKRCAVNAMFVTAYNADVKDQLTPLAKGCLPVLCSQLDTDDKEYLNLVLLTIISFLFWEFKAFLGKEKKLLTSEDTLSPFAVIIQDCDGLQRLKQIKESNNNNHTPTQEIRRVEEILALAFHVETRPPERKQSLYLMSSTFPEVNPRVKQEPLDSLVDEYSINLNEFKGKVFPRLWELLSTTSALMLLQLILYNDYKTQKSQLIK
ncbi:unnamed protein product, partial [Oppiella nova]